MNFYASNKIDEYQTISLTHYLRRLVEAVSSQKIVRFAISVNIVIGFDLV